MSEPSPTKKKRSPAKRASSRNRFNVPLSARLTEDVRALMKATDSSKAKLVKMIAKRLDDACGEGKLAEFYMADMAQRLLPLAPGAIHGTVEFTGRPAGPTASAYRYEPSTSLPEISSRPMTPGDVPNPLIQEAADAQVTAADVEAAVAVVKLGLFQGGSDPQVSDLEELRARIPKEGLEVDQERNVWAPPRGKLTPADLAPPGGLDEEAPKAA